MKWLLHKNFNLCIATLIYMLFDLYIVSYEDIKDESFINGIHTSLLNNTLDIDKFVLENDVDIYSKIITNVKSSVTITRYDISYKLINLIKINSNGSYQLTENDNTKTLIAFLIKKFDTSNYIMPVMISFSNEYLDAVDRKMNLDSYYEFLNNKKEISNLLTKFNIINI